MPSRSRDPPDSAVNPRRLVQVLPERIGAVAGSEFPGHHPGEDHKWDPANFRNDITVSVQRLTQSTVEFDLVGVDASIANAIRRVMIAEIPTIAIEDVYVWNNTSIMQDEVFAHRLGLVPLAIDPRTLDFPKSSKPLESDTIVFDLRVRCDRRPETPQTETDPRKLYYDSNVYSGMMEWVPSGNQNTKYRKQAPAPVTSDILLCKLRPGQVIDFHCFAKKGVGMDHTKFSPVGRTLALELTLHAHPSLATASYRLLPHIIIRSPIPLEHQEKFQRCFPPGVVEVEDDGVGEPQCVIKNPRKDTVSREVLRHPEFQDIVQLSRIRDHFIFSVESVGQYKPQELLPEAIKVLLSKVKEVEDELDKLFPPIK